MLRFVWQKYGLRSTSNWSRPMVLGQKTPQWNKWFLKRILKHLHWYSEWWVCVLGSLGLLSRLIFEGMTQSVPFDKRELAGHAPELKQLQNINRTIWYRNTEQHNITISPYQTLKNANTGHTIACINQLWQCAGKQWLRQEKGLRSCSGHHKPWATKRCVTKTVNRFNQGATSSYRHGTVSFIQVPCLTYRTPTMHAKCNLQSFLKH